MRTADELAIVNEPLIANLASTMLTGCSAPCIAKWERRLHRSKRLSLLRTSIESKLGSIRQDRHAGDTVLPVDNIGGFLEVSVERLANFWPLNSVEEVLHVQIRHHDRVDDTSECSDGAWAAAVDAVELIAVTISSVETSWCANCDARAIANGVGRRRRPAATVGTLTANSHTIAHATCAQASHTTHANVLMMNVDVMLPCRAAQ